MAGSRSGIGRAIRLCIALVVAVMALLNFARTLRRIARSLHEK